jgi:hypothetical protein
VRAVGEKRWEQWDDEKKWIGMRDVRESNVLVKELTHRIKVSCGWRQSSSQKTSATQLIFLSRRAESEAVAI